MFGALVEAVMSNKCTPLCREAQSEVKSVKSHHVRIPTTFRPISGFALPSMIHNNQPLLEASYFGTSATALRHYWYDPLFRPVYMASQFPVHESLAE